VGSGHSAFNAILDLVALRESEPATQTVRAIRGGAPGRKYGGGGADQLPARGALGAAVRALVDDGSVALAAGFQTRSVEARDGSLVLADGEREIVADEVIAANEQVRSVVAALAGDWESARRVELVLPDTGVCSRNAESAAAVASACCGAGSTNEAVPAGSR
jgi:hypothetical protein